MEMLLIDIIKGIVIMIDNHLGEIIDLCLEIDFNKFLISLLMIIIDQLDIRIDMLDKQVGHLLIDITSLLQIIILEEEKLEIKLETQHISKIHIIPGLSEGHVISFREEVIIILFIKLIK